MSAAFRLLRITYTGDPHAGAASALGGWGEDCTIRRGYVNSQIDLLGNFSKELLGRRVTVD